jgi:hypothetical protein
MTRPGFPTSRLREHKLCVIVLQDLFAVTFKGSYSKCGTELILKDIVMSLYTIYVCGQDPLFRFCKRLDGEV